MINANTREYWNESWEKKVKKFPVYTMNRVFWMIPESSSVLDIGCGDGRFIKKLKEEKGCQVTGIDISDSAISIVIESSMEGIVASAENLDHIEGNYDVVVATHIFEHVENDVGFARNVARLSNDFAIIAVPNDCSFPEHTHEHVRKYDLASLTALLSPFFKDIENHSLKNHLILKCLK